MKDLTAWAVLFVVIAAAVALIFRVPQIRDFVTGGTA